ncbi:MAG: NAD(P)-binding protein, partial [Opitutaceae bacterium]|nr:NAD(P)-binding protein [Opitutaceae bacterium]
MPVIRLPVHARGPGPSVRPPAPADVAPTIVPAPLRRQKNYDYVIVGAGLFGAVFAHLSGRAGKKCLVLEKRPHVGGNLHCQKIGDINVHAYGPHIFHTSNRRVWEYMNSLAEFNRFTYSPLADYQGELLNLPFNMNTFYRLWGTRTPEVARKRLTREIEEHAAADPGNLEEQALK